MPQNKWYHYSGSCLQKYEQTFWEDSFSNSVLEKSVEGWERFTSLLGTSAKPLLINGLMLQPWERRPGRLVQSLQGELWCLWHVLLQKQLFRVENMYYFLHRSLQPHTERKKLSQGRERGPMPQCLWQAEQMHNFILKEITCLYELPLLCLPPLLVAFAFLESEPTTQKK